MSSEDPRAAREARIREYLHRFALEPEAIYYNAHPPTLYEAALKYEKRSAISSTGALIAYSGEKTGRSPLDKRIVVEPEYEGESGRAPPVPGRCRASRPHARFMVAEIALRALLFPNRRVASTGGLRAECAD